MNDIWQIILLGGLLTYVTRFGGHVLIARIGTIPPRLEAALNAVPAAVLTTIVVPTLVSGDWPERVAVVACAAMSLRLPMIVTVVIGTGMVAGARALGF